MYLNMEYSQVSCADEINVLESYCIFKKKSKQLKHTHTDLFKVLKILFQFNLPLKVISHFQITAFLASWLVTNVCLS